MLQTRYWMFQNQLAATLASAQIASSSTPSTTSASASALRFTPQPSEGDPSPLLSGIPALVGRSRLDRAGLDTQTLNAPMHPTQTW
ncbi:hypothetical protein V8E52_009124 [Russula decolorans]